MKEHIVKSLLINNGKNLILVNISRKLIILIILGSSETLRGTFFFSIKNLNNKNLNNNVSFDFSFFFFKTLEQLPVGE